MRQYRGKIIQDEMRNPKTRLAAERTLLAWNRTSLSFMGFGFLIERFDLFTGERAMRQAGQAFHSMPFWIGLGFILLGVIMTGVVLNQYRRVFLVIREVAETDHFDLKTGLAANALTALLGLGLIVYMLVNAL